MAKPHNPLRWDQLEPQDKNEWLREVPTRVLQSELSNKAAIQAESAWGRVRAGEMNQIQYIAGYRDALIWVKDKFFRGDDEQEE